jgi:hypothetical protein
MTAEMVHTSGDPTARMEFDAGDGIGHKLDI